MRIWNDFIERHRVVDEAVPLFTTDESGVVGSRFVGRQSPRRILQRSDAMNALIRREVEKLVED